MLSIGSLVKFKWWSSYRAPSVMTDDDGHVTWHEIQPGEKGIILYIADDDTMIVLFSSVDSILKVHRLMLEVA